MSKRFVHRKETVFDARPTADTTAQNYLETLMTILLILGFVLLLIAITAVHDLTQVAVGAVHVDGLVTGLVSPTRRLSPRLHQLRDLLARQRTRRRVGGGRGQRARRHDLPAVPVVDLGRRLERCPALHGRNRRALRPEWPSWMPGTAPWLRMNSTQRFVRE